MGDGTIDAGDVTIGLRGLMARFLWDGRSGLAWVEWNLNQPERRQGAIRSEQAR